MAGTIADSGTAVADITATSACRTESDYEYSGTVTAKATFTCGTTGTAVSDGTSDKAADIQTKEEITLRGNRYSVDRLIGNGGEAEVYVVSCARMAPWRATISGKTLPPSSRSLR